MIREKITISSRGRILIPAKLRRQDGIKAEQEFEVTRLNRGDYRLTAKRMRFNDGLLNWLLACPEKGYFVAIESTSTDSLRHVL